MQLNYQPGPLLVVLLVCLAAMASYLSGKMDRRGAASGIIVGLGIYAGDGLAGLFLLMAFFLMGTGASSWKAAKKRNLGLLESKSGRRSAANVFANGAVACMLGLLSWSFPAYAGILNLMLAASLTAATSDTISSELGNVYGSRFFRITTGEPGSRGLDGIISPEGTILGATAAVVMGGTYLLFHEMSWQGGLLVAIAGFAGNLIDSVLGATFQGNGRLNNHQVNALNTLFAALLAGGVGWVML